MSPRLKLYRQVGNPETLWACGGFQPAVPSGETPEIACKIVDPVESQTVYVDVCIIIYVYE